MQCAVWCVQLPKVLSSRWGCQVTSRDAAQEASVDGYTGRKAAFESYKIDGDYQFPTWKYGSRPAEILWLIFLIDYKLTAPAGVIWFDLFMDYRHKNKNLGDNRLKFPTWLQDVKQQRNKKTKQNNSEIQKHITRKKNYNSHTKNTKTIWNLSNDVMQISL